MLRWLPFLLTLCGAMPAQAMRVQLHVDSIEHPDVPAAVRDLHLDCRVTSQAGQARCDHGRVQARVQDQPLSVAFEARVQRNGRWQAQASSRLRGVTASDPSGRYASDQLDLDLDATLQGDARHLQAEVAVSLLRGQAYAEPVFIDFGTGTARLSLRGHFDRARAALVIEHFELDHAGVMQATGTLARTGTGAPTIQARLQQVQLGPAFATYLQPFLAGTRAEKARLSGRADALLDLRGGAPQRVSLNLIDAGLESDSYDAGMRGLNGALHWQASAGAADASRLRWDGGHVSKLELGAAEVEFLTSARDLKLLAPLRLPLAGGALNVHEFAVQRVGRPNVAARFDAHVEPIDLATLCRAFGWPEFGGQLGGRLPGLSLAEGELKLDGALTARAFDGDVALDGLRVIDPFGRVPRVEADLRLRNLDLAAITRAFSFGRIDGRIDGDVQDLRLLNWQPISFRARLATPPDDRSRHRISQRAIDTISAVGGGPTGVLQRGALRFFDDFAYSRIGWTCELANGVCRMGGLGTTREGGFVLVQGRLLPRIDVVGYARDVDWNTFVSQLAIARSSGLEVR